MPSLGRQATPGPGHDTGAAPSPGVNDRAVGVTVTCAHTPPASARAVSARNDPGSVQNHVSALTTVNGCPSCKVPAGYRPVVGDGTFSVLSACRASTAGSTAAGPAGAVAAQNVKPFVPGNARPPV